MSAAALNVYETLRHEGTQKDVVHIMQTRAELYELLDYHEYERKLDQLLSVNREKDYSFNGFHSIDKVRQTTIVNFREQIDFARSKRRRKPMQDKTGGLAGVIAG